MFGSMCEYANGMDSESYTFGKYCKLDTFDDRVSSAECLTPSEWKKSFDMIADSVTELATDNGVRRLGEVDFILCRICRQPVFSSFANFCSSEYFTQSIEHTISLLFYIGYTGTKNFDLTQYEYGEDNLEVEDYEEDNFDAYTAIKEIPINKFDAEHCEDIRSSLRQFFKKVKSWHLHLSEYESVFMEFGAMLKKYRSRIIDWF